MSSVSRKLTVRDDLLVTVGTTVPLSTWNRMLVLEASNIASK